MRVCINNRTAPLDVVKCVAWVAVINPVPVKDDEPDFNWNLASRGALSNLARATFVVGVARATKSVGCQIIALKALEKLVDACFSSDDKQGKKKFNDFLGDIYERWETALEDEVEDFGIRDMIYDLLKPFIGSTESLLDTAKAREIAEELIKVVPETQISQRKMERKRLFGWLNRKVEKMETAYTREELFAVFQLATGISEYEAVGGFSWSFIIHWLTGVVEGRWWLNLRHAIFDSRRFY